MMLKLNGGQRYSFGLFAVVIGVMVFASSFAGCDRKEMAIPAPVLATDTTRSDSTSANSGLKYLALGDSYTIGQSVPELARFPVQASGLLTSKGLKVSNPDIIARTGWTTDDLLSAIAAAAPTADYDIVSLLIGVNDQYQRHDTTGYRQKFTECLLKAIALARGNRDHVFVLSIPDYSVTPFGQGLDSAGIARQIDQFNDINRTVAATYGISYTDVTATSRAVKDDPEMVASDGLHPGAKQYTLWANLLVTDILKKFP